MFKLLRYFSITSLLSIAIAAAVFGYCYRTFAYRSLTETGQANNATVARALANAVSTQLARYIATAESMSAVQLQSHPAKDEFSALLARNIQGLSIVKLKVIDPRGLTLYSTSPNQISDDESTNPGFMAANSTGPSMPSVVGTRGAATATTSASARTEVPTPTRRRSDS